MDVTSYIIDKWNLHCSTSQTWMPIFIPDTTRRHLNLLFAELGYCTGAEIGVNKGSNALKMLRVNPELHLFLIDPWTTYDGMNDFTDAPEREEAFAIALKHLSQLSNVGIIKKFSMDALIDFDDEVLDFVYIDGNHEWPYITQDIFYWAKKVKPGGIVAGHDYIIKGKYEFNQVTEAVDGYTKAFGIKPWFVMDKAEHPGRPGTWFWVKHE